MWKDAIACKPRPTRKGTLLTAPRQPLSRSLNVTGHTGSSVLQISSADGLVLGFESQHLSTRVASPCARMDGGSSGRIPQIIAKRAALSLFFSAYGGFPVKTCNKILTNGKRTWCGN